MTRSLAQGLSSLAVFGMFWGCGGVADSGLFGGGGSSAAGSSPGGQTGSAGAVAGASSVGGMNAVGGAPASAGAPATGGSSGIAGAGIGGTGQAGASAAGSGNAGRNTGGASGAGFGGSSAGGGPNAACTDLLTLAAQQLVVAQTCNIAMNSLPCTGRVSTTCGCEAPIGRVGSSEAQAYLATLKQIQDKHCVQACPAVLCPAVKGASCSITTPASIYGMCIPAVNVN